MLNDQARRDLCAGLAEARRALISGEPLSLDERAAIAGLLEQFEANVLAMDACTAQLDRLLKRSPS